MAHVLNVSGLTLNPKEETTFQNINAYLAALTYMREEITRLHAIDKGITMKTQIVIPGLLGKSGLKGAASCDRQESGARSVLTEKFWEPIIIEDTFKMCPKTELDPLFKQHFDKIQSYREIYEFEGASDEQIFIGILMEEAIMSAIWRAAWLGDKDVAAATATVAGLKSAADVKFYNYFDGFLKQIITGVAANTIPYYQIDENTKNDPTLQKTLLAGRAEEIFEIVKTNADIRLKGDPNAVFYVNDYIFDNYKNSLRTAGKNFTIEYTMKGVPELMWDGNKVINCESMFGLANRTDFVNNTTDNAYRLPNFVIFSTPENLRLGTLNENDFSNIESWYNQDERKQKMAYGLTLDAKVVMEHMVSAAF